MPARDGLSEIEIKVLRFRPYGNVTTATIVMELKNSRPVTTRVVTDDLVTLIGSYNIRVKRFDPTVQDPVDPRPAMRIKFSISTHPENPESKDDYQLLGVSFLNRNQTMPTAGVGQTDFTNIEMATVNGKRTLTVTNNRVEPPTSYDYLFLIQRVSDGSIGIIDPEFENE